MSSPSSHKTFVEVAGQYDSPVIIPALSNMMLSEELREPAEKKAEEQYFYFTTTVNADDLLDAVDFPPQYLYTVTGRVKKRRSPSEAKPGVKVVINGTNVAIYKYKGKIFAIEDRCSHQGGPLHVGDIEEVDGKACVACPHHGFSFDLQTGICVAPRGSFKQEVWPVRIEGDGLLSVGFRGISHSIFDSEDF
jgi:nitrite reductase/ring-hydroxylating ferredoxin subunit